MTLEFKAWPKTPRLFRDIVITEKIDGTNAAVIVLDADDMAAPDMRGPDVAYARVGDRWYVVGAQSRKRIITPTADNFGFATWVFENAKTLAERLGVGYHYGEWWGRGIQRGYGLDDRRFSLFNVNRYADLDLSDGIGLGVVPVLYRGPNHTVAIRATLDDLAAGGSVAAPGFPKPEGVIVFHTAAGTVAKVLIEGDEAPKGDAA